MEIKCRKRQNMMRTCEKTREEAKKKNARENREKQAVQLRGEEMWF
jgi:hypothetical protein